MTSLVDRFTAARPAMLEALGSLVDCESPSSDLAAVARCADAVSALGRRLLGAAPVAVDSGGRVHLGWRLGERPRVGLVGHFDTVWPLGTLASKPFAVDGDRATGPGVFDMKAGIVMGMHAVAALDDPAGVEILLTSDEEIGSHSSRPLIEALAERVDAVLVLEPSAPGGTLKVARKGCGDYDLDIAGVAAHAGLEPEKGVNALVELARLVEITAELADPPRGTTVTPTMASAGTAANVVPAAARLHVDVRALSVAEQERVDAALRALRPMSSRATISVSGGASRPPLEEALSAELFARAARLAARHGLGELRGTTVGGGSDGNITAALGTPTLDGLGAVGDGAHADHEHIVISALPVRTALLSLLIADLLQDPPSPR